LKASRQDEQSQKDAEICDELSNMNLKNDTNDVLKTCSEKEVKKEDPDRKESLENWRKSSMLQGVGPFLQLLVDATEGDVTQSTSDSKTSGDGKHNLKVFILISSYSFISCC
jgi:hypothetical protein